MIRLNTKFVGVADYDIISKDYIEGDKRIRVITAVKKDDKDEGYIDCLHENIKPYKIIETENHSYHFINNTDKLC